MGDGHDSHIGMQAIAALTDAAELETHAVDLQKGVGITLGIEHADLVVPSAQIAFRAAGEIALGWFATAEQHRLALLRRSHGLLEHDLLNHLLKQDIGPEKNFFSAAMEAQWLFEIDISRIQTRAAAQCCEHGAGVAPLNQVLEGAATPAIGQVGHVEDHGGPWAPD